MYGSILAENFGALLIFAGLTCFVAGLMRGFAGFGSAMLMAPIFAVLFGPVHMVPLVVALELPMGVALFAAARKDVDWGFVGPLSGTAIVAMPLGIWFLVSADTEILTVIISVVILVFVAVLIVGWRYRGPRPLALTVGIGAVSGAMMATSSVGGPPVLLYMLASEQPAVRIRANIIAYYLFTTFALIAMVVGVSPTGVAALVDMVILLPFILVGMWLGMKLTNKASEAVYRWVAYIFLTAAALFGLFA